MNPPTSDLPQDKALPASVRAPHVVVFPLPAQGHVSPCLAIADYLAANDILVTLVHAIDGFVPQGLPPIQEQTQNSCIRYETIPSGADHSSPFSLKILKDSVDSMRNSFTELLQRLMLEDNAPVCLLLDSFFGWGYTVAQEFGLSHVVIWTGSAYIFYLGGHLPDFMDRGLVPATAEGVLDKIIDFIPGLSPFRLGDMPKSFLVLDGLQSDDYILTSAVFGHMKPGNRIIINTMYDLEASVLDALCTEQHLHVYPVGPLNMMRAASKPSSFLNEDYRSSLQWLDHQKQSSVLYISFGSVAALEEYAFTELAYALEGSGERFLWVIRREAYKSKPSVEKILPEGFMERIRGRGLVIPWAPQLAVLAHPAVGAFLTHCGWNSILESLSNGVPMLGFPQMAEQDTNLRLIVDEWKVGLPLSSKHKIERHSVQGAVNAMMNDQQLRTRAGKWKEIASKAAHGSSNTSFLKLVAELKQETLKYHQH